MGRGGKLETMFRQQEKLQQQLGTLQKIRNKKDLQQYINQNILALVEESIEIARCTPYKNPAYVKFGWKSKQGWDRKAYAEEIVDLFHFLMNLCVAVKITPAEFFKVYCRKNNINQQRRENGY